jgi:hypothetical protein
VLDRLIDHYERRIAEEEQLAQKANSPDAALAHSQAAMLYRTELAIVRRSQRNAALGDTLAEIV